MIKFFLPAVFLLVATIALGSQELRVGDRAPEFYLKNQRGEDFDLRARKAKWTVLYFYPKAETPGCTKQACAFRDNIEKIKKLGAEVYGVSVNSVEEQSGFAKNHKINFDLLADSDAKVTELYGVKMMMLKMAKRWTFILDGELKIRDIEKDVDPVKDAEYVAGKLSQLQQQK